MQPANYFHDSRESWWNPDYLALLARRLHLDQARAVLDVGCGQGHWTRALASVLSPKAHFTGIDREERWLEVARERAGEAATRFTYLAGTAERLPFEAATFDVVTCQTLLCHVADPAGVIAEMARVLKPGGLMAVVEPNNLACALVLDSVSVTMTTEDLLAVVELQLRCERGKQALGEGYNSIGDLVPGLLAAAGLEGLDVWLDDKTLALYPPYASGEQRVAIRERMRYYDSDRWVWSQADTRRYFAAGGGDASAFDRCWAAAIGQKALRKEAVRGHGFHGANGGILYVSVGRKPA
ncbi:MAG: hypothetical protein JWM80_6451 [Cyanobacteria bacterium RYN_339]|nr:hypothetical protein [Cyanobacteria bacterium RYN_339]